jgi:hypothetical protein
LFACGCSTAWRGRLYAPPEYGSIDPFTPFLKAHTADGRVYVLDEWELREGTLLGRGLTYDVHRALERGKGPLKIPLSDVKLVETNQPETVVSAGLAVIGVVAGASLALTAFCLANTKACFGSCPTFTVDGQDGIVAEGFSESVARPLEATDVDALPESLGRGEKNLSLWLKNEALETHLLRKVRVLAVPRTEGERIVRVGSAFHPMTAEAALASCRSAHGDCTPAVRAKDDAEYRVPTDEHDLAAPDVLELEFAAAGEGPKALVLRGRNSLVHTYVFYQLLAWLGVRADDWFHRLELEGTNAQSFIDRVVAPLSTIGVEVWGKNGWEKAGEYREVGPIALDEGGVALPDVGPGPVKVRLTMAQGAWKLDRVALAALGEARAAVPVDVARAERKGASREDVVAKLKGEGERLATYPGEAYRLGFDLPQGPHQLFLESTGYYYEWVRDSWVGQRDEGKFFDAVLFPKDALKALAPGYKKLEPGIEQAFWQSRVEAR